MPAFVPPDSGTLRGLSDHALAGMLVASIRAFRERLSSDSRFLSDCALPWPTPHDSRAVDAAFRPFTPAAVRDLVRLGTGPGTPWLLAILAGAIPAVAVNVLFWSLAARVPVVLRPARSGVSFVSALVEHFARLDPALAPAVQVSLLPAGSPELDALIRQAPACLAYGDDSSVASVARLRQGRTTFLGGHRESAVLVFHEAVANPRTVRLLARAVARDVALYDQSGCLSPQVVLYEDDGGVAPESFAEHLAGALRELSSELPAGRPDVTSAAILRAFADEARIEARLGNCAVFPDTGQATPLVILRGPEIPYRPGPGHRVIQILPFSGLPDLPRLLPGLNGRLQGLAVAGPADRLATLLGRHPGWTPCRVCRPGRLQHPPAVWRENGIVLTRELAGGDHIPSSGNPFEISS